MSGSKQDCAWLYFDRTLTEVVGKAVSGAMCKKCSKEIQGFVTRFKQN